MYFSLSSGSSQAQARLRRDSRACRPRQRSDHAALQAERRSINTINIYNIMQVRHHIRPTAFVGLGGFHQAGQTYSQVDYIAVLTGLVHQLFVLPSSKGYELSNPKEYH